MFHVILRRSTLSKGTKGKGNDTYNSQIPDGRGSREKVMGAEKTR